MRELNVAELSLVAGAGAPEHSWWDDFKNWVSQNSMQASISPGGGGGGGGTANIYDAMIACTNQGGSFQGSSFNTSVSAGVGGRPGASASVNIGYSSGSCIMPQRRH
ncbi:hypothetical protein D1605_005105 [Xylella fastidiosa subsp. fastidiosa]|jgi:hypothetical protein|uniref:Uncharacterized protein n=1 Tax=Xylella fastidiosa (strain M23) TaxID=405441 RepID=B2I4Y9_XYLF2|nr:hypothetical protein [Xylella fastidiosa]ACB92434.1 hypothetical protein XfasM23_1003 [Xylella fastidiosa M23]EGO81677.1 hypothetical protein XFEB_01458 [Xylella fastidiosa EB92.1]MBE0263114.1 hypothetical protein [Xylella fastidiosa subsp. fastidiosa]MBE0265237.1 hypothetical protein [Xylella fastidiosa subsp. fastidiosa]MBE0267527.1 hypothetical protein [Xylella fastidiosa subsp. fastidiosa]